MAYPSLEAKILSTSAVSAMQAIKIAAILSEIHQLNICGSNFNRFNLRQRQPKNYYFCL